MKQDRLPISIAVRLWAWAAAVRVLKRIVPVQRLVSLMHTEAGPHAPAVEARLRGYMERRGRFPRRAPGNCLERSLGAYRILCAAGSAPELVIGVRRTAERGVEGHVWIRCGGQVFGEPRDAVAGYAVVTVFDASASRQGRSTADGPLPYMRFR